MSVDPGNLVTFTAADWEWRSRGVCTPAQDDIFFGETAVPPAKAVYICTHECPVAAQCFEYAMSQKLPVRGVWGGTSEAQRRRAARGLPPLEVRDPKRCPAGTHDASRLVAKRKTSRDGTKTWSNGVRCLDCEREHSRAKREKAAA